MPRTGKLRAVALLAAASGVGGCGGEEAPATPELEVFAATSLDQALASCAGDVRGVRVRLTIGPTGELAAKIRRGFRPDVLAAADTARPATLARDRILGRPVHFATNELVVAVPNGSEVRALDDLDRAGTRIVIAEPSVSLGRYTDEVLRRLPPRRRAVLRAAVVTEAPSVQALVQALVRGTADAGFAYRTDVIATDGALDAVPLAADLRPRVTYAAGVVTGTDVPELAERYVEGLRSGPCSLALRDAGFGPPGGGS